MMKMPQLCGVWVNTLVALFSYTKILSVTDITDVENITLRDGDLSWIRGVLQTLKFNMGREGKGIEGKESCEH